jgi:hypothetical protein
MSPGLFPLAPLQISGTSNTSWFEVVVLVTFVAFGMFSWYRRLSYRISVAAGLVFLALAAIAVAIGQGDAANFIVIPAYYSLTVGVVLAIAEFRREERGGKAKERIETRAKQSGRPDAKAAGTLRTSFAAISKWVARPRGGRKDAKSDGEEPNEKDKEH